MMQWNFAKGAWDSQLLTHAACYRFPQAPIFHQDDDCIRSGEDPTMADGYDYVTLLTREKLTPGVKLTTHVTFEGLAAPLVVLAKDLYEEDGVMRYGDYLETVIWKNGLNVWELWQQEPRVVQWHRLLGLDFSLDGSQMHELSVEVQPDRFEITLDGHGISLLCKAIFPSFHFGITGCEGTCRFYDMKIEPVEIK